MREGEPAGGLRFASPVGSLRSPDAEQAVEAGLDVAVELILLVCDRERDLVAARDVDVDESARDVGMAEPAPEIAVAEQLPPVALDAVTGQPQSFRGEMRRLEFLDQPRALGALDAPVEASREHGGPALDGDPRLEVDLTAVRRVSLASRRENSGMNFRSDTETPPSVTTIEPDAVKALVLGELPDVDLERLRGLVELHGKGREKRKGKKFGIEAIIIFRC